MTRQSALLLLSLLLAGCARLGPGYAPSRPAELSALYQAAEAKPSAAKYVAVGNAEARRRHWLAAVEAFEAARQQDPADPDALASLAALRLDHGERDAALKLVQTLDEKHPNDAGSQATVGRFYLQLGRRELGLASYRRALDLDPREPAALFGLGQDALQRGRLEDAKGYRARLRQVPDGRNRAAALTMGIAQAERDPRSVETLLRQAFRDQPSESTRAAVTVFLLDQQQWRAAEQLNQQWLAKHPDSVGAEIAVAEAKARQDDERGARRLLTGLNASHPDDPRVQYAYGKLMFEQGFVDLGTGALNRALELAPVDTDLQLRIADLFARYDNPRRADELYVKAGRENPQLAAEIARRRGLLMQGAGVNVQGEDSDPVEMNYALALRANPNDVLVLNNLAFRYAERNVKLDAAKVLIDRAVKQRPNDPNIQDTRGFVALRQKDYEAASAALDKAVAGLPNDPLVRYHLALLHEGLGDRAMALKAARKALDSKEDFIGKADCQALLERLESKP